MLPVWVPLVYSTEGAASVVPDRVTDIFMAAYQQVQDPQGKLQFFKLLVTEFGVQRECSWEGPWDAQHKAGPGMPRHWLTHCMPQTNRACRPTAQSGHRSDGAMSHLRAAMAHNSPSSKSSALGQ